MRILILEDWEGRIKWFRTKFTGNVDYAYTSPQANEFLQKNEYDVIFLDHDLSDEHYELMHTPDAVLIGTGVDTAKYIAENKCSPNAQIILHTLNPVGSNNMFAILKEAGYRVEKIPFLELQRRI